MVLTRMASSIKWTKVLSGSANLRISWMTVKATTRVANAPKTSDSCLRRLAEGVAEIIVFSTSCPGERVARQR